MSSIVTRALNIGSFIGLSTANRVIYVGSANLLANDADFTFDGTNVTITNNLIIGGSLLPDANDGAVLGSATLSFSDLFLASGAVINFNNGNLILTHAAGVLLLNGASLLQFRDTGISIGSSVDGTLNIVADTILNLGSTVTTLNVGNTAVTTANLGIGAVTTNVGAAGDIVLGSSVNKVGFYGSAGALKSAVYTRNATIVEDRTLLASASATVTNNNNVLAALIADLKALNLIG